MAPWRSHCNLTMARTAEGTKVFIDQTVLDLADRTNPPGMSRTSWINYLIQVGAANIPARATDAA